MAVDAIEILERIAETGTAPDEGCSAFGVGFEDAFSRLTDVYLRSAFSRGRSAEKFIIGPFGSGKTQFLRQLMEIARDVGCATAEVPLNKDIDFTQTLLVFQEVAREIRAPGQGARGIHGLLEAAIDNVRAAAPEDGQERVVRAWIDGIEHADFEDQSFARILKHALDALIAGESTRVEAHCRWLSGEVADRTLAKELSASAISKAEHNRFGRRAMLSLCQFIRHARFNGTVIGFDEAEQGFTVNKRQLQKILSMLQSSINATADLKKGSALIVYALTPDLEQSMENFAALQQRVSDPGPGQGFFDGNTRAAKIDLTRRDDPTEELKNIGASFVELLYRSHGEALSVPKAEILDQVTAMAVDVAEADAAVSNRRVMAKRCCTLLINLYESGSVPDSALGPDPEF